MRQRLSRANRTRVFALLACALFVRALVPTGWMPVVSAHGVVLALCSGQNAVPMSVAMHHAGMADGGKKHGGRPMPDHPCAFAGLGPAADTAPPPFQLPLPAMPANLAATHPLAVAVGRGLAAPPPPATGPPPTFS